MSTHRHFDKICCVILALTLLLTALFVNAERFGVQKASAVSGYENALFDTSRVHTIDIIMDDWDTFIANCKSEEYYACTVVIDNDAYKNVAIRGKGNTSLSQVDAYGNDRYSFKIEFDHYDSANTYYGLDKLCLNNIIQDNTYMKDYLTYQMMNDMGVAAPLCSYAYITVNGEDWGLYLAVEGVEEAFLQRNYGSDYGELYKPDSSSMGGGRGNGEKFDLDEFLSGSEAGDTEGLSGVHDAQGSNDDTLPQMPDENAGQEPTGEMPDGQMPDRQMPGGDMPDGTMQGGGMQGGQMPDGGQDGLPDGQLPEGMTFPADGGDTGDTAAQGELPGRMQDALSGGKLGGMFDGAGGGMIGGSDDVLLKYIDDDPESYANIFDNAKTAVSAADKTRLIQALKKLSSGEDLESAVAVDAVIRYFVVHNFVLNFDSYTGSMIHNYYLYEEDGQLQMIPWDYNLAFGGFQSMSDATSLVNYPIDSPVSGGSTEDRPMLAWIFENEAYTALYHQYFSEFISEYFDSGYFEEMMDRTVAMISPYVEKDPTKFCTYEEFVTGAATLREFCLLRAESVSGQLSGTIGSASDTQEADTLIDAGDIQISAMGSMDTAMGGGMARPDSAAELPGNAESGDAQPFPSREETGGDTEPSDGTPVDDPGAAGADGAGSETAPQMPGGNGQDGALPAFAGGDGGKAGQGGFDGQLPEGFTRPDGNDGQAEPAAAASSWLAAGASVLVLALGLAFALLYKRRR